MNLSGITICFLFATFFVFVYVVEIIYFIFGWMKGKKFSSPAKNSNTSVSIVIAARNEEKNIEACLHSVFGQNISTARYEVILVNDHSDDATKIISAQFKHANFKFIELDENEIGKKAAISTGIKAAKNELIILMDADCTIGSKCIGTIISFYETHQSDMILLPVLIKEDPSLFSKIQSLETLAMLAVTASSANWDSALLANGAGIVYSRSSFLALKGFEGNLHFPGGDDMMMLEKMKQEKGKKIEFLLTDEALVETPAAKGFPAFFDQRVRWASKTKHYSDKRTRVIAVIVFLASLSLVFTGVSGLFLFNKELLLWAFGLLIFKAIFDFLFLFLAAKSFNRLRLLVWFLPVQLFYPFYVLIVAVVSMFSTYTWKGRIYKV